MKQHNLYLKIMVWMLILVGATACNEPPAPTQYEVNPQTELGKVIVDNSLNHVAHLHFDSVWTITPGLTRLEMDFLNERGLRVRLFLYEVDLKNKDLSLVPTMPNNDTIFATQEMTKQALAADKAGAKILAAVNGDFFFPGGEPQGICYIDGTEIKRNFADEVNTFAAVLTNDSVVVGDQAMFAELHSKSLIRHALGGRVHLMNNGVILPQTSNVAEPRTGIGVTKDQKVYLLAADGRNFWYSNGMTYTDMAKIFYALGVRDAINLDGGGSTSVVYRKSKGFEEDRFGLHNWPSDLGGVERKVANGWAVASKSY